MKLIIIFCLITVFFTVSFKSQSGNYIKPEKKLISHGNSCPDDILVLKTLWKYDLGKNKSNPVLVFNEGMIFWGNDDGVFYALDASKGKIKWQFKAGGPIYEKPVVQKSVAFFCSFDGNLHAVDINTGQEKWKYFAGPEFRCTPSIFGENVVIIYKKQLISLDIETGLELWKKNCLNINFLQYFQRDSVIYFSDNMQIIAINALNCTSLWQYQQQIYGMSKIQSAFDYVYFSSLEGVYAIQKSNGKPKWKFGFDKTNPPTTYNFLTVSDSNLYVPVDYTLYVFNAVTGKIAWGYKSKLKKDINNVSITGDKIYFTESSDIIYVIGKQNTRKIDKFKADVAVNTQLHVENSVGYFISADGFMYAVKFP